MRLALDTADLDDDPLPSAIRARHGLFDYARALRAIHLPVDDKDWWRATKRLKWDEALILQVVLAQRRRASAERVTQPRPAIPDGLLADFDQQLPFQLTAGQLQASEVIAADLANDHPMHRLLQGEVGSGKTIVALRAMLQVIDAAGQAALLAPTEVLAQQHHRSIIPDARPARDGRAAWRSRPCDDGHSADRLPGHRRAAEGVARGRVRVRPGSWSARMRCSRTRCSSPTLG